MDIETEKNAASKITNEEASKEEEQEKEMETDGFGNPPKLFTTPFEKFMDEFEGSVKALRRLFTIPKANAPTGNLYQKICNTAKIQFEISQEMSKSPVGFQAQMNRTESYNFPRH